MRIWYAWDADDKSTTPDDKGRTDAQWGTLREPQYFANVIIHADASPSDETDDPNQPVKAGWSQRDLSPNLNELTHEGIYDFLSATWTRVGSNLQDYSIFVDHSGNEVTDGFYRTLKPGIDIRDFDWINEQEKSFLSSFGPFTMQPGDDYRVVVAYVGGSISLREAIDAGRAYANGAANQQPLVPLPNDLLDEQGNVIATAGNTLTRDQKDAFIDSGKDKVFKTASRAIRAWNNSNVRSGAGTFNIPFAPAAPSIEGFSENDQVRLTWGDEAEDDNRAGSIAGYRIYRDYKRATEITRESPPTDSTFFLLDEVGPSVREYVDTNVSRGENYYYYVTAVTSDGIESNPFQNRTGTSATREDEALSPTRSPAAQWESNDPTQGVVVVPNPFHASAANKYDGKRLNFLNLPAYANIHIYTMTGDLVQTIEHDGGTGDQSWLRQETFSTVEIVSGVYIYVVEELDGPRGSATGRKKIDKFVVIK
jgi:hypothetical protein